MSLTGVVEVPPRDREVLQGWMRSPSIRAGLAQRARIVLLAADGVGTGEIASRVGTSKQTVISWKHRYRDESLGGLDDRPKPGRPQVIDEAQIVVATLEAPPAHLGVTHWSSRLLGAEFGLSHVTIGKVWRKWNLQPWRWETFKFSTSLSTCLCKLICEWSISGLLVLGGAVGRSGGRGARRRLDPVRS